ncbi:MAG: ParB/RepB/Spo0J family partition protein [Oscillospiraceae bacterium]|nr:ParB/RepB/Spo0J family partition protein [Oscillospiraceae bacterium]
MVKSRRLVRNVSYIPIEDIVPGPLQPRSRFPKDGLQELSESIARHGVIQPLTVRPRGGSFELIAGERRLRAAKLAGLMEVPCVVMDIDLESSGIVALIENIQRADLDFVEEAQGISRLIRLFGMSQEEAARRLGKSQSAIANKLRILKLPPEVLERLRDSGFTERHARALLRLDEERLPAAVDFIIDQRMTVAETERYVERLTSPQPEPRKPTHQKTLFVMKDVRLLINTLNRSLDVMRRGGIDAGLTKSETEDAVVLTVRIPKGK